MVSKLTLLKISLILPALFFLFDEPKTVNSSHSSLTATFLDMVHCYDSIATNPIPIGQSTDPNDPGGSGRIDITTRGRSS